MNESVIGEIWTELKRYIGQVDRSEAADVVVSLLIDNDYDVDDIRSMFRGDADIKKALVEYQEGDDSNSYDEEEEEFDEEEFDEDYE